MRVGIVHSSLNVAGGADRLCLKTIEALREAGHKVMLATVEPTDWKKVGRILGKIVRPNEETSLINFKLKMFGIYMRLLTSFSALKLRKKCDVVVNTHGDVLPVRADITYMHYPMFALLRSAPINTKYSESLFWRAYFAPYEGIQGFLFRKFLEGIILTNSNFSKKAIKKYSGKDSVVIYPPVDIQKFTMVTNNNKKRKNIVISCGRYSIEKNYEFILKVADKIRGKVKFIIIGTISGWSSKKYYEKLNKIKKERHLENVELLKDVPLKNLLELYGKAKIYMHAMKYEHFGISIVEGMAAGLVPIVHRSGGPWEDILKAKQGVYGFSYMTVDEAVEFVEKLITNDSLAKEIVSRNMKYVHLFSSECYKKNILNEIEKFKMNRSDLNEDPFFG